MWQPQYLEYLRAGPEARPLFPGYAFARIAHQWRDVASTWGVFGIVRFGEEMARVPESVLEELNSMCGPSGYVRMKPRFNRWSRVRVVSEGIVGIVQARESASRVRVLFQILGRAAEMSMADEDLVAA